MYVQYIDAPLRALRALNEITLSLSLSLLPTIQEQFNPQTSSLPDIMLIRLDIVTGRWQRSAKNADLVFELSPQKPFHEFSRTDSTNTYCSLVGIAFGPLHCARIKHCPEYW